MDKTKYEEEEISKLSVTLIHILLILTLHMVQLEQVEGVMKLSLQTVMAKAVEAYPKEARKVWVLNWPGQVVLAASIVHWTTEVSQVIDLHNSSND